MEDGLLSFKWNNHKSTFFHILSSLRKKETYTDATLACEGRFFPVHKLVMSTCSDYFCEVFENTNCKSPVVILKDIKHHDLEVLLDYMYLGEVDVKQNELAGLIKAAECLRIKGLAVTDEDPAISPKKTHIPESRLSPSAKRAKRENVSDASSNAASCSNLNHHTLSPSRSHSSTISITVPSQSVNSSDTLSQVRSHSLPPSYSDKRHSSLSVNDNQKHIDQSDIVPVEMIKVEVDDENSSNSQLQQSKDRPIGQSGAVDNPRGEGSGNNIEESHRVRESISNNFSDYSAGNQSTDIEKEEHDPIDPFSEFDQVAGPSGVQELTIMLPESHLRDAEETSKLESEGEGNRPRKRKMKHIRRLGEESSSEEDEIPGTKMKVTVNSYPPPPDPSFKVKDIKSSFIHESNTQECTCVIKRTNIYQKSLSDVVLTEILTGIEKINSKLDTLLVLIPDQQIQNSEESNLIDSIPLGIDDFIKLNEKMAGNSCLKKKMMKLLMSVGGRDSKGLACNILRKLLVDEAAQKYSLTGKVLKNGILKHPFEKTEIYKLILEICGQSFKTTKETEVRDAVSDWLIHAKFRKERREKRMKISQKAAL